MTQKEVIALALMQAAIRRVNTMGLCIDVVDADKDIKPQDVRVQRRTSRGPDLPAGARSCPACLPEGCAYCGGRGWLEASSPHFPVDPTTWSIEHEVEALLQSLGGSLELERSETTRRNDTACVVQALDNAVAHTIEKIALYYEGQTGLTYLGPEIRRRFLFGEE
tara:strand:+ start:4691 stop:5185 length:495 start_codon:yes stop_codon:yes gene_type:complete